MISDMEQLLYQYNPHWANSEIKNGYIERPLVFSTLVDQLSNKHIIFLSGLRRIGKTTIMRMMIQHLLKSEKVEPHKVFYVSLDNYLLRDSNLFDIINEYRKIHDIKYDEFTYFFLDEVTYLKDYEQQLKNLYDLNNCKIFASSSNASVLKSSKAYLTGRSRLIEIPPLDYNDYLLFKNIKIQHADFHFHEKYFLEFLKTGGIPEYILSDDVAYIQDLIDDIIYKDIIARHQLKNPKLLQDFFLLLMERAGKQFSITKMAKILAISTETAKRYLEYFADTYLIYLVERHGKTNERILSPKKIYAADLGIRNLYTGFRDIGALFENYVYLKIRHLKPEYLYENKTEIDFITNEFLIEAKYKNAEMSPKQEQLFNSITDREKIIVRDHFDLKLFDKFQ
jgi:predicted AAA+ superfamily ATPase